jgi:lipoyl(octanoyl) transferase
MADKWRLIIDGPGHPVWNMAVDEALLYGQQMNYAAPVLRFYTWDRPTLSIGHFQKASSIPLGRVGALGIFPVRRISGGAAVLHGCDLTYSVAARVGGHLPQGVEVSCQYICRGILEALKILGIPAEFGQDRSSLDRPASCFVVSAPTDIVYQGRKLVGSAQHRHGESLLQHGSVMLRDNSRLLEMLFGNSAEDSIALEQILLRPVPEKELVWALRTGFSRTLGVEMEESDMGEKERSRAEQLVGDIPNRWPN